MCGITIFVFVHFFNERVYNRKEGKYNLPAHEKNSYKSHPGQGVAGNEE